MSDKLILSEEMRTKALACILAKSVEFNNGVGIVIGGLLEVMQDMSDREVMLLRAMSKRMAENLLETVEKCDESLDNRAKQEEALESC